MGLRCLFGHDFTEPELERERETSGGEVVITVREAKTCRRCGETQIVSENKEVTSVEQLAETARAIDDDGSEATPEPVAEGTDADEPVAAADAEEATAEAAVESEEPEVELEEAETELEEAETELEEAETELERTEAKTESEGAETESEGTEAESEEPAIESEQPPDAGIGHAEPGEDAAGSEESEPEPAADAASDDGVILEDDLPTDPDRDRGAWPDASDTRQGEPAAESTDGSSDGGDDEDLGDAPEPQPWPEQRGEDEGYDAEPGGGTPDGVSFENGLTPEAADEPTPEDDEGVEFIEGSTDEEVVGGGWPDPDDAFESDDATGSRPHDGSDTIGDPTTDGAAVDDAESDDAIQDSGFTRATDSMDATEGTPFDTEFFCPECGHAAPTDESSMRAGDICPECHRGYIAERER